VVYTIPSTILERFSSVPVIMAGKMFSFNDKLVRWGLEL